MIVRELLQNVTLLDKFDYFNDSKDTINWLKSVGANDLADLLNERTDEYWTKKLAETRLQKIANQNQKFLSKRT